MIEPEERLCDNFLLLASGLRATGQAQLATVTENLLTRYPPPQKVSEYLLRRAEKCRLVPALSRMAARLRMDDREDLTVLASVHEDVQKCLFREASAALDALEGLDPVLIKGSDFAWSLYSTETPRQMADVDMLVMPHHLDAVVERMTLLGYRQGWFNRDTLALTPLSDSEMTAFLKEHYEMPPFLRLVHCEELDDRQDVISRYCVPRDYILPCGGKTWVLIEIDAHYNLSFDLSLDVILQNKRSVEAWGKSYSALSWETIVWFLAARIYVEGTEQKESVLRGLVDLIAILAANPNLDWKHVISVGELYGLFFSFHYVFEIIAQLDPALVPKEVLDHCSRVADESRHMPGNRGQLLSSLLDSLAPQQVWLP